MDTLGCGFEALEYPACTKLLGPIDPETVTPRGAKVPGTKFQLDPVQAAFNIGAMIRWLDFNDTWLAAEWGHPSDNLGGILAVDPRERQRVDDLVARQAEHVRDDRGRRDLDQHDVVEADAVEAVLERDHALDFMGLDHRRKDIFYC